MPPILQVEIFCLSIVMSLLVIGCYFDFKYREVKNWITGSIFVFLLPLIYYNRDSLWLFHVLVIVMFWILYAYGEMGGADLKVLVPIILVVPNPIIFMAELAILGLFYGVIFWEKKIPYFIPITMAFVLIIYSQYVS